jgi:hypothetical protein
MNTAHAWYSASSDRVCRTFESHPRPAERGGMAGNASRPLSARQASILWEVVAPLLRDLEATGQALPDIRAEAHADLGAGIVCAWIQDPGGTGRGISVLPAGQRGEQLYDLAEQLQDWASDVQADPGRGPWPDCPARTARSICEAGAAVPILHRRGDPTKAHRAGFPSQPASRTARPLACSHCCSGSPASRVLLAHAQPREYPRHPAACAGGLQPEQHRSSWDAVR